MDLEQQGRLIAACGADENKLARVCYLISERLHKIDPEYNAPPDLLRARMVARHYISEIYGVENAK